MSIDHDFVTKDSGMREEFSSGAKRDIRTGKGRYDLLPPAAIARLAQLYERGATKYGAWNFAKGMSLSRCLDSLIRHAFQYSDGQRDEDHICAVAWNALTIIYYEEMIKRGVLPKELDDLPKFMNNENFSKIDQNQSQD